MPTSDLSPASGLLVCNIVLIVLSTLSVAVRFYTRFFIINMRGWDDCELAKSFPSCNLNTT